MRIAASAPGKLVLLGEYAVLEGAPALVLAVDRRARATLTPIAGDEWEFASPTFGRTAYLRIDAAGPEWCAAPPAELAWLATLLARTPLPGNLAACRVELDTGTFQLDHAGQRIKLGLGSSAALAVALQAALHAHAGLPAPTLDACIDVHRAIQRGRGSGIDIAASLEGGLLRFQLADDHAARATPVSLPDTLHWRCVFSGRAVSTSAMLAKVAAWRARRPTDHARRMYELATIAARGIAALTTSDATAFLSCLRDYSHALARLGEASGADIASEPHRALAAIAADCGVVYKSCGAGGGDVGITFGVEDVRLREFEARATHAGFPVIGLAADPQGLHVDSTV